MKPYNLKRIISIVLSFGIFFFVFFLSIKNAQADVLIPGTITTCGEIAAPGTYTLGNNIGSGGDCITITSNSSILDGAGFTLTGNVIAADGIAGSAGINISLQNITVTGTTTSGNGAQAFSAGNGGSITIATSTTGAVVSGNGGLGLDGSGGVGGSINITNATTTTVTSGNGGNAGIGDGARGGHIVSIDSVHTNVTSGHGGDGDDKGGVGGNISISKSSIDLSDKSITAGLGGSGRNSGTVTLTYSAINTNSNTFIYNTSDLIINTNSYGPWNGSFNPLNIITEITEASQCSDITFAGTYSFVQDITGDCILTRNDVIIDGAGYTLTGNFLSSSTINISVRNVIINGDIITGDGIPQLYLGWSGSITVSSSTISGDIVTGDGAEHMGHYVSGGSITISNSSVGNIISGSSGTVSTDPGLGGLGNGGSVIIENSTFGNVTTGSGGNSSYNHYNEYYPFGDGGSVTITNNNLNIRDKTITVGEGGYNSRAGNLTLIYNGVNTNPSTFFYNINELTINNVSFGSWNGVFNPTIFYFNDTAPGAGNDGDWANANNWWSDASSTVPVGGVPNISDQVFVNSNITQISSGAASVNTIVFNDSSINNISITIANGATFTSTSQNNGTINGNAIFKDNLSDNNGSVSGSVTRLYTTNATTTRDFINEGTRNDWIVVAQGSIVDISGATYSTDTNVFQEVQDGLFVIGGNGGGQVVPNITINSPITGTTTIKWLPNITWDTSSTCNYSYDNFASTLSNSCLGDGLDITKPSAGTNTFYVRGTDSHGSFSERSLTFLYDNTVAIPTLCGTDLLDEVTRPYYYLEGDISGKNCTATANVELRGASSTDVSGFTLDGNVIASAISTTNGFNLSLKNITVTGSIISNGATSTTGYNGGSITVATSTTGAIISNGGDGSTTGGNGGTILISGSTGIASSTEVISNGGNALTCGRGGDGGSINLFNSSYGSIISNAGLDQSTIGPGLCIAPPQGPSGSVGSQIVSGNYTPPTFSQPPSTVPPTVPPGFNPIVSLGSDNIPVSSIGNLSLPEIPKVDLPFQQFEPITLKPLTPVQQVIKDTNNIVNSPTSKAVQTVGFFAGLLAAISLYANTLFATPLLVSELLFIPVRLWGLLLMAFGLKKRTPPWGTVYDSITKRPIDPAFVTVSNMSGEVVAQSMTDIDGRYGFLLPDGKYRISAEKTNYKFPSKKMTGLTADELYRDLYFGEEIEIKAGEVIDKNIPLDPIKVDWNEQAKVGADATVFHKKNEKVFRKIGNYVFRIGLVISLIALALNPSTYNIIMVGTYVIVLAFSIFGVKGKKLGFIRDRNTGEPYSYAIFRVTTPDHQTVLRSGVCDKEGRYYCIVPKGQYYIEVEKKNSDGSYTKAYQSDLITTNRGIINTNFAI